MEAEEDADAGVAETLVELARPDGEAALKEADDTVTEAEAGGEAPTEDLRARLLALAGGERCLATPTAAGGERWCAFLLVSALAARRRGGGC